MNFKTHINLVLLFFLLIITIDISAQSWTFVKEQEGIKLFTRKDYGSSLKSFKGVMDITSTMDKVCNLL